MSCSSDCSLTGSCSDVEKNEYSECEYNHNTDDDSDFEFKCNGVKYYSVKKIGAGSFANVWICKNDDNKMFAAKIQKTPDESTSKDFVSESTVMKKLKDNRSFVDIIDISDYCEDSECPYKLKVIVMELCGKPLSKLSYTTVNNLKLAKIIMKQLLRAVDKLHKLKIIHTDIKPENILSNCYGNIKNQKNYDNIDDTEKITQIKLADFGSYIDFGETNYVIQTKNYRAPEIILKYKCNEKCDIWSIGCVLYEILTNEILFLPEKNKRTSSNIDHIRLMIEYLGMLPENMINSANKQYIFNNDKVLNTKIKLKYTPLYEKIFNLMKIKPNEHNDFILMCDLLYSMLTYDPDKRPSASQCLNHKWVK